MRMTIYAKTEINPGRGLRSYTRTRLRGSDGQLYFTDQGLEEYTKSLDEYGAIKFTPIPTYIGQRLEATRWHSHKVKGANKIFLTHFNLIHETDAQK